MGVPELLVGRLTLLNERLDERLIDMAIQQHGLDRKAAARFVEDQVREKVTTALLRN